MRKSSTNITYQDCERKNYDYGFSKRCSVVVLQIVPAFERILDAIEMDVGVDGCTCTCHKKGEIHHQKHEFCSRCSRDPEKGSTGGESSWRACASI